MKKTTALFVMAGLAAIANAQNPTVDQARAAAAEARADAANRTSLLATGYDAGHDGKGFHLGDGDNYRLYVGGQIQFRYNMNFRDEDVSSENDDFTHGFQTRRTKLEFYGNVINPDLKFKIVGAFDRGSDDGSGGGGFALEDAFVSYDFNENVTMTWGQFKVPFNREEMVSSKYQLAADRSVVNEVYNADRTQGINLEWHNDNFRIMGAFTDGYRAVNSDFTSSAEADYALTARAEYNTLGDWSPWKDFTSFRSAEGFGALIGGAIHWQDGGETGGTSENELFAGTLDVSLEGSGWNVFGALIWVNNDPAAGSDTDNFGFVVQGGFFLTEKDEIFGRWDMVMPDDDTDADDFNTLTFGWNHYFAQDSHAAKFTLDVQWFLDSEEASGYNNTGINLLPDNEDDQFALRAQFQLLF